MHLTTQFHPLAGHLCRLLTPALLLITACSEGARDPRLQYDDEETEPAPPAMTTPEFVPLPVIEDPDAIPEGDVERPDDNHSQGFFVLEGRLYDRFGNDFVMRGVNNAHAWFDPNGKRALGALDEIADKGFNAVRIVWEASNSALSTALLREVLNTALLNRMIPILELHDVTGSRSSEALLGLLDFYTREDNVALFKDFEKYLLINLANEWSGDAFLDTYSEFVSQMRAAGLNHTLVIDANGWGQNAAVLFDNGSELLQRDPEHNLLFSAHMYEVYSADETIRETFERAAELKLPFIVGEFGPEHNNRTINVALIQAEAARLGFGTLAWSWKGNDEATQNLDMAVDWGGRELTDWGRTVVDEPNGVAETALRASVFLLAP